MKILGMRREDKSKWERRTPLVPSDVRVLRSLDPERAVLVEPSATRIFPDDDYLAAGATVQADLSGCDLVMGIKEMPATVFQPRKSYIFFSHTIKGNPKNMPMLKRLMELGCTLLDYERIVDEKNRRLVFFGHHAGLAGMIDTLWALGRRLDQEGRPSVFSKVKQAFDYSSVAEAKECIAEIGDQIARDGLPPELCPFVVGFTGYGRVSQGAQEIFDLLPHRVVDPHDLQAVFQHPADPREIVKVVFREEHTVRPRSARHRFDLQEYFTHPDRYESIFFTHIESLSVLVNCIFWAHNAPKLLTRADAAELWAPGATPRLRVIGDISCDIEGGVEITTHPTQPDDPVYVYEPATGTTRSGVAGHGPVVLAVDNLPCEIATESSEYFSHVMKPFVPALLEMDTTVPFEQCRLPDPLRKAVLVWRGELTPEYAYMNEFLR